MGLCASTTSASDSNPPAQIMQSTPPSGAAQSADLQEFALKKTPNSGCTGMFWRSDPTKRTKLESNNDWPRDGAMLRGTVVEESGEKWLLCTHVKQANKDWKAAPAGAAMPFEYAQYHLE